jgi:hypothetical protein
MTIVPMLDATQDKQFTVAANDLIAQYGGDAAAVVKALMIYNCYLEDRIAEIAAAAPGLVNVNHDGMIVAPRHAS